MQKRLFILLLVLIQSFQLATAQSSVAKTQSDAWIAKYDLNEAQQQKAIAIAERKQTQLGEIEPLKTTTPKAYYAKLDAVQNGTLASIRLLLDSKEQLAVYNTTLANNRKERAEAKKQLQKQGLSEQEISQRLVLIFSE